MTLNKNMNRIHYVMSPALTYMLIGLGSAYPSIAFAEDSGVEVSIRTVEPDIVTGRLDRMSLNSGVVLVAPTGKRLIDARDIISIEVLDGIHRAESAGGTDPAPGREGVFVELAGGDRVRGRIIRGDSDAIIIETPDLGVLTASLEQIAHIRFSEATGSAHADSIQWFENSPSSEDDRLLLTNGDVVRGFITTIDREGVTVENGGTENTIPLRLAVAARFSHPQPTDLNGTYVVADFREGTRMRLTSWEWVNREIKATSIRGATMAFDSNSVARLTCLGGRWEWLSDLSPASSEHTPMLSLDWEFKLNRDVLGGPLTVANRTFSRGIGVHSRSSLIYELKGAYQELATSFGMDDDSGPAADVNVSILIDGQRRFERSHVRIGTLHGPVRLDVTKANRLELIVDFGDNGDLQDRFDWIETGLFGP